MLNYHFIDTQEQLQQFAQENKGIEWMCFDTEFVGEKRFYTLLCVIQLATPVGNYVIDPIKLKDIGPILDLLADPDILTITHAGENDYRLLSRQFDLSPANTFDTQIAAAFIGYKYPVSFQKLVGNELGVQVNKSYTVTNWEARPLSKQQIDYALGDVIPLYDLWQTIQSKLEKLGRVEWAKEEFVKLESSGFFEKGPYDEALQSNLIQKANQRERIFLLRLFKWRNEVAAYKNYSKEMILPSKLIGHIMKGMRSGKRALRDNRRLPNKIVEQQWSTLEQFYNQEATAEELALAKSVKRNGKENPEKDLIYEMLYSVIKYKCLQQKLAVNIAFPRGDLKKIKENANYADEVFKNGWRQDFFGQTFNEWLKQYQNLSIEIGEDVIQIIKDA